MRALDLSKTIRENPDKSMEEAFNVTVKKLDLLVVATAEPLTSGTPFSKLNLMSDNQRKEHLINSCRRVPETRLVKLNEAETYEGLKSQIRGILSNSRPGHVTQHTTSPTAVDQHLTDRKFNGTGKEERFGRPGQR